MYLRLVRLSRAGQLMMARSDATTAGTNNFGIFPYNQISPFGFNGAFYYGRLTLGF